MTTVERIFYLLNKNNMTAKDLSKAVGLSGGNITDWKKGRSKPSVAALEKIANYFHVSVDFLLGNSDKISYEDTLTKYLRPLKLSNKEFNLFKEMALSYINQEKPEITAKIIQKKDISKSESDKILNALEVFADLADEFEKTTRLNKVSYVLSKDFDDEPIDINSYDYIIENTETADIVRNALISALNNLNSSQIISTNDNLHFYMCPVYGRISAGMPNWAEECIEGRIPIDPVLFDIVNPEEHFFLRVNGESMNKEIRNGAYALIHKQDVVENGDIAVVLVNGDEATLKKFSKQGDLVVLEPMSTDASFNVQVYDKNTPIKILGKYIGKFEMK